MKITFLTNILLLAILLLSSCKGDKTVDNPINKPKKVEVATKVENKPVQNNDKAKLSERKQTKKAPKKDRPVRKSGSQNKIDKKYEAMASQLTFLTADQITQLKEAEIDQKERIKNAKDAASRKAINKEMIIIKRKIVTNKNYKKLLAFEKSYRKK